MKVKVKVKVMQRDICTRSDQPTAMIPVIPSLAVETHARSFGPLSGLLNRIRNYVDQDTLVSIYKALIQPHLEYGCIVWDGLDKGLVLKLQRLQNRAARIITRSSWEVRSKYILANLEWETLENRRHNLKKKFMSKVMNGRAPEYIE